MKMHAMCVRRECVQQCSLHILGWLHDDDDDFHYYYSVLQYRLQSDEHVYARTRSHFVHLLLLMQLIIK